MQIGSPNKQVWVCYLLKQLLLKVNIVWIRFLVSSLRFLRHNKCRQDFDDCSGSFASVIMMHLSQRLLKFAARWVTWRNDIDARAHEHPRWQLREEALQKHHRKHHFTCIRANHSTWRRIKRIYSRINARLGVTTCGITKTKHSRCALVVFLGGKNTWKRHQRHNYVKLYSPFLCELVSLNRLHVSSLGYL